MGRAHSRAYRAVHEHYPDLPARPRLLIAADVAEAGRRDATELLGYDESTADYREVLGRPDVDVVSICAPNFLHREMALAAAEAGKPFWIEKPMGRGLAESDDIARAAARAGLITAVAFSYRHVPAVAHARALVSIVSCAALKCAGSRRSSVDADGVGHVDGNGAEPLSGEFVEQVGSWAADDNGAAARRSTISLPTAS